MDDPKDITKAFADDAVKVVQESQKVAVDAFQKINKVVPNKPITFTAGDAIRSMADLAKIAGEVVDPSRTLPRVLLGGLAATAVLYLALNAAFLQVLPLERIAASNLVAADVMDSLVGARGAALVAGLALLVVLASLNGNVFVTPRVLFGLARDGLAPAALARVNAGGTPWVAIVRPKAERRSA